MSILIGNGKAEKIKISSENVKKAYIGSDLFFTDSLPVGTILAQGDFSDGDIQLSDVVSDDFSNVGNGIEIEFSSETNPDLFHAEYIWDNSERKRIGFSLSAEDILGSLKIKIPKNDLVQGRNILVKEIRPTSAEITDTKNNYIDTSNVNSSGETIKDDAPILKNLPRVTNVTVISDNVSYSHQVPELTGAYLALYFSKSYTSGMQHTKIMFPNITNLSLNLQNHKLTYISPKLDFKPDFQSSSYEYRIDFLNSSNSSNVSETNRNSYYWLKSWGESFKAAGINIKSIKTY